METCIHYQCWKRSGRHFTIQTIIHYLFYILAFNVLTCHELPLIRFIMETKFPDFENDYQRRTIQICDLKKLLRAFTNVLTRHDLSIVKYFFERDLNDSNEKEGSKLTYDFVCPFHVRTAEVAKYLSNRRYRIRSNETETRPPPTLEEIKKTFFGVVHEPIFEREESSEVLKRKGVKDHNIINGPPIDAIRYICTTPFCENLESYTKRTFFIDEIENVILEKIIQRSHKFNAETLSVLRSIDFPERHNPRKRKRIDVDGLIMKKLRIFY